MYHRQFFEQRIGYITLAILCAMLLISSRLFYLQVICCDHYASRGEKNFLRIESIPPQRGNIYDCTGTLMATNRPITHLVWNGTGNDALSHTQRTLLEHMGTITQSDMLQSKNIPYPITIAEKQHKQCVIAPDVSLAQLSTITEHYPNNPNIGIRTHFERYYPEGSQASHIIGYLSRYTEGDSGPVGKMGLEKICDDLLKGHEGSRIKTVNSRGRNVAAATQHESLSGTDIYTTINIQLQRIAERIYPENQSGCILIMDPENGAIRALVSRPAFDPALFLKPISYQTWADLQHKKPFLNRAITPYPLGSIFKLVTISAALEHGLLHPDQRWNCEGFVPFAGRKYWCNRRWGHGKLTTPHAFAKSCNMLFFELGKEMDIDMLANYAQRFGLGHSTNFLFPDSPGIVPSRDWKMMTRGERWWPGETLSVAIGQSFLMATPLQVARMISAIFTGVLVRPRILESEEVESFPLNLHPNTQKFLRQCMRLVVTNGIGKKVNGIEGVRIAAKTSTAQLSDLAKRKLGKEYLEHAWFAAHFQYKKEKPLVFLILVENAGSSQVASSIARELAIELKKQSKSLPNP